MNRTPRALAPLAALALASLPALAQRRAPRAVDLAMSNTHACVRTQDGAVRCWGFNRYGEVGDATTAPRLAPAPPARGISHATALALGAGWSCALAGNTPPRCWGRDDAGQFGDSGTANHPAPAPVRSLRGATQLALGADQSCARMRNGSVMCWQRGADGIHPAGAAPAPAAPPPSGVSGITDAVEVTVGARHACARLRDGTARCWGDNHFGQLGDGTYAQRSAPVTVFNLARIAQIAAGGHRACARLEDGTVRCWGMNTYGQLGDGTNNNNHEQATPVAGLSNVAEIALGDSHACARLSDGTVRCWGLNDSGQLGDGTRTNRFAPVAVAGLSDVAQIAAGGNATCARTNAGAVVCWGFGGAGQLGDGNDASRPTPGAVTF